MGSKLSAIAVERDRDMDVALKKAISGGLTI